MCAAPPHHKTDVGAPNMTRCTPHPSPTPRRFWAEHGKRIDWIKPFTKVKNVNYDYGNVDIKWFEDGTLNVAANCIDRHLADRADQTAIIFEPDDPNEAAQHITYRICLKT
jgi:acetyl-CoA synthetase